MLKKLYRLPVESARHAQLKKACLDYFTYQEKLMSKPSRGYAFKARKALLLMKRAAHERGMELLQLYAEKYNRGKPVINNSTRSNPNLAKQKGETHDGG